MDKPTTNIDQIIEQAAHRSTLGYLSRTAEKAGEELATEIMRDPQWREEIQRRLRAAVIRTIDLLSQPKPPTVEESVQQLQASVQHLETMVSDLLTRIEKNGRA